MVASTTASLPMQANLAGSDTALGLTMYAGEVFKTFRENFMFKEMTRTMNVGAGKSHQFPVLGQASATRHVRGENIFDPANGYLDQIEAGQRLISVDRPVVSNVFVDDWDELLTHYEFRGEYAAQQGQALARFMDQQVAQVIALAARSGATLTSTQAATKNGQQITKAAADTSATAMIEALIEAAVGMIARDVPMNELHAVVKPAMYYELIKEGSLIDKDFNPSENGSKANALIVKGYGLRITHSNFIPDSVVAGATGDINTYAGDFTKTQALVFGKDCVGTAYRQGVVTEVADRPEYQGDLVISRIMTGTGILRPECAAEIVIP